MNKNLTMAFALAVCLAGSVFADSLPVLYSRFTLDASNGVPRVDSEFTLTFKARADLSVSNITVVVSVPDGIVCLDDSTRYTVSCSAGESTAIDVNLRCESPGPFHIQAYTFMSPAETLSLMECLVTDFYIYSQSDTAFWSDSLLPEFDEYNLYGAEPDTGQSFGPMLDNCTVSGKFRYRLPGIENYLPIRSLYIELVSRQDFIVYGTTTNEQGDYSLTVPAGTYVFRAYSVSTDCEVHRGWQGITGWAKARVHLSPAPFLFRQCELKLEGDREVKYTAEGRAADWARVLDEARNVKQAVSAAGGSPLDRIEVTYSDVCTLRVRYIGAWYDTIVKILQEPGIDGLSLPMCKTTAVYARVKLPDWLGGAWIWYGVDATWRYPYQIVLRPGTIWDDPETFYHEWSHIHQFTMLGDKIPYYLRGDIHSENSVRDPGFAFAEGFAEFQSYALYERTKQAPPPNTKSEDFSGNYVPGPWWHGGGFDDNERHFTTRGDSVEGAVAQFFWDLCDDANTLDPTPGWDDDGLSGGWSQLWQKHAALGNDMTKDTAAWMYLGRPNRPDSLRLWWHYNELNSQDPNAAVDFTGWLRDHWSTSVSELYNVDVHPFSYSQPFALPVPTNLAVTGRGVSSAQYVDVQWTDNTQNEGMFLVRCRPAGSQEYLYSLKCQPSTGTEQEVNYRYVNPQLQGGETYEFSVAAVTCDTSEWSEEAEALPCDVRCIAADVPSDTIGWGTDVTPSARTYNNGSFAESYVVRMKVVNESDSVVFDTTASVTDHEPGDTVVVYFPNWLADQPGDYAVSCSTGLAYDGVPSNDRHVGSCTVLHPYDASADDVTSPWRVGFYEALTPTALVSNHFDHEVTFWVKLVIDTAYVDSCLVESIPGLSSQVEGFAPFTQLDPGPHDMKLIVRLADDQCPANDTFSAQLLVVDSDYWLNLSVLPWIGHAVLVEGPDQDNSVYAVQQNGSGLAKYSVSLDLWNNGMIPPSSVLSAHTSADRFGDYIFALGTYGPRTAIARYAIGTGLWDTVTTNLPSGAVENGGIFARHTDTLYVLLRNAMQSFYRYIVPTRSWTWLQRDPPLGSFGTAASTYDGGDLVHVLQVTSESLGILQTYDLSTTMWQQSPALENDLPPGAGIAITTVPDRNSVFALWSSELVNPFISPNFDEFDLTMGMWMPLWPYFDSVGPHPSMTSRDGLPYASCGISQVTVGTFGRYYPLPPFQGRQEREGSRATTVTLVTEYGLSCMPNPFTGSTTIRWQVPKATRAEVAVYDVQGRLVKRLRDGSFEPGRYAQAWDTKGVPAGVYLCSFTSNDRRLTQRLVLMK